MSDLVDDLRVCPIEQACEDGLARVPDDFQDGDCDQQAHDRIRQRVAQPDPHRAEQHCQAGQAIHPGVIPIGHQRGATDLFTNFDAKEGHRFIADKSD